MKNPSYQSQDDKFIQRLTQLVLDNLKEEQFSVEHLAAKIGLSRSQLYRRLKRSTGQTISQYIRQVRLQKARELLENDVSTTSEIAFQVGFSSPAYFHKCFNEYFGLTPGELKRRHRENETFDTRSMPEKRSSKSKFPEHQQLKSTPEYQSTAWLSYQKWLLIIGGLILTTIGGTCFLAEEASDLPTIAVLPIDYMAKDMERNYLANNLNEALKMELGKSGELHVISKASTISITRRNMLLKEMAEKLGVDAVIEGSILAKEDSLWVKLQLIVAYPQERLLWAKAFQLEMDQTSPFEKKLLQEVSREVRTRLLTRKR